MIAIDPRTVILLTSAMSAAMAGVLYSVSRDLPANIRGIDRWMLGSVVLAITALLFGLRNVVPDWLSVIAANGGLLLGVGLWLLGIQLFYGRPPSNAGVGAAVGVGIGCASWWLLAVPDYALRLASMTAILLGLYGVQLRLVIRYGERHSSTYFLVFVLLIQMLVLLVRGATSLLPGFAQGGFFSSDLIQTVYFATYSFITLLFSVGFVMAATRRLNMELNRHATRDPLTGLFNRRAFSEIYEREYRGAKKRGDVLTLLIADLDHFKTINDQYGHAVGDRVLVDFCQRATVVIGSHAPFARLGGEEFAALLQEPSPQKALAQAEKIRHALFKDRDDDLPRYTCSIGVATTSKATETLEQLLRVADEALYRAKRGGRNRVESGTVSVEKEEVSR